MYYDIKIKKRLKFFLSLFYSQGFYLKVLFCVFVVATNSG